MLFTDKHKRTRDIWLTNACMAVAISSAGRPSASCGRVCWTVVLMLARFSTLLRPFHTAKAPLSP